VEAAGFVLDEESTLLANKDDQHSIKVSVTNKPLDCNRINDFDWKDKPLADGSFRVLNCSTRLQRSGNH